MWLEDNDFIQPVKNVARRTIETIEAKDFTAVSSSNKHNGCNIWRYSAKESEMVYDFNIHLIAGYFKCCFVPVFLKNSAFEYSPLG